MKIKISLMSLCLLLLFSFKQSSELNIYVSPAGNDINDGSINSPFRTLDKAKTYLRTVIEGQQYTQIIVNLRAGTYLLNKQLVFTNEDSGSNNCHITFKAFGDEKPVIAGAVLLPNNWVQADKARHYWKIKLNAEPNLTVTQLFANSTRLHRASSPVLYTAGPLKQYKATIDSLGRYNFNGSQKLKQRDLLPFCSFAYAGKDLNNLNSNDIQNAEVLLYHSWDCSRHDIAKIDTSANAIYLKSLAYHPVGFFADRNRYVIENCKKYLSTPGDWFYDKASNEIWYVSDGKISPNSMRFYTPRLKQLIYIKGEGRPVQNIKFEGITFNYSVAPRGRTIDDKLKNSALSAKLPWLDFTTGFSSYQADIECGQTILLENAANINFSACTFSMLGSYALRMDKYSSSNKVSNCEFFNNGGGGVIIGFNSSNPVESGIPPASSPANNVVENCSLHNLGVVYPSSVGISIMNANNSIISKNEVYDLPYSGISCGWSWGFKKNYTYGNRIVNNKIYDVMKLLADGGGIYTLGVQTNTVIKGNVIHDIHRSKAATGGANNGIFFDEGSSELTVDSNTIYNIQNKKVRFNKTDSLKMTWRHNN